MMSVATDEVRVSLEPNLLARLDAAARHVGMSRNELLTRLVEWALHEDELEDALDGIIADRAYDDPDNQERIPGEQVFAESHAAR